MTHYSDKEAAKLLERLASSKDDEAMTILCVKILLMMGDAEKVFGCSKIERYRFEVQVGVGRVDVMLFHKDGGISLVEVKANREIHSVIAGIGQLFMYEAEMPIFLAGKHSKPKYIKKILAAAISPEKAAKVIGACKLAGIHYAFLASHKDALEALRKFSFA